MSSEADSLELMSAFGDVVSQLGTELEDTQTWNTLGRTFTSLSLLQPYIDHGIEKRHVCTATVRTHQSETLPEGGRESLRLLGGGTCVSGCPWGSEMFCDIQQRLSSHAVRPRFANVVVLTSCAFDFKIVILTLDIC